MPSIDEAAQALADAVGTIDGLRTVAYADDQINPPQAHVYTRAFDPRMTLGGSPSRPVAFGVRVFVRRSDPRTAQRELRNYMEQSGDRSIRAAVETSGNWSETVHHAEVSGIGQPFEVEGPNEIFWAVDFDVDVVW